MDVKVVTIDFWNTLYHHSGTPEYRKSIRGDLLTRFLKSINYDDGLNIARTFYEATDQYVNSRWNSGSSTSREEILDRLDEYYENRVPMEVLSRLLDEIYRMYTEELRPILVGKGEETLKWLSSRASLYIISDTFTLVGKVLDRILAMDGLIDYFRGRYYSDEIGVKKAASDVMTRIESIEQVAPNQIVHIGDLLETDGALAKREGTNCIIVGRRDHAEQKILPNSSRGPVFGFCEDFSQVKGVISEIINM